MSYPVKRLQLNFGGALCRLINGQYNEKVFQGQVAPIRHHLMDHDGMVDCVMDRYSASVDFIPEIISEETVKTNILAAIALTDGDATFFPYLKPGTPKVTFLETGCKDASAKMHEELS
jgi:hypothetical protein